MFVFWVRKVIFKRALITDSDLICYYLELKVKEDQVLERQKRKKDSLDENNKNIYSY